MPPNRNTPIDIRLRVLSAVDFAPGESIRERIKYVASKAFVDAHTGHEYQFTWRTISTWLYRYKKHGVTSLDNKTRADKNSYRKIQPNELAEAINEILPTLSKNKTGTFVKSVVYHQLQQRGFVKRHQLSQTSFYRMVREHNLLDAEKTKKLRLSFCMQYANELWQADTMYGPSIKQGDGSWRKTFLIAFLDDASRVITHGEFFYRDNTENMIDAFRTALFKRGKPDRLYFDNGANYKSTEILQACLRLDIRLSHAPVRDGAAKGKIERFFRGFRDRFLTQHVEFQTLEELNEKTHHWIENEYNAKHHSGIQMIPIDRFALDVDRVKFLTDDKYSEEIFFVEQNRKVSKTNVFSINSQKYECPVDLRGKTIQVRYSRSMRDRFIVFFADKRMGEASLLNVHQNADQIRELYNKNTRGDS
ncbi:MAG: transposase family protein [Pseudomonadales bacterium]|nr:transposase family protein [Pseudomonadales bacterium]MBL4866541.1 transposase family protein [Pseudomonadales bacterium]MBL4868333.1 transposase family protein [Pseudomonadales bacterium]